VIAHLTPEIAHRIDQLVVELHGSRTARYFPTASDSVAREDNREWVFN